MCYAVKTNMLGGAAKCRVFVRKTVVKTIATEPKILASFAEHRLSVFKRNRYPKMSAVVEMFRIPNVCHENKVRVKSLAKRRSFQLVNIRCLRAECLVCAIAPARIFKLFPRAENVFRRKHTRCIWRPARTSARYQPIHAVFLEYRGRLVLTSSRHSHITSVVRQEIVGKLCYLQRKIVL